MRSRTGSSLALALVMILGVLNRATAEPAQSLNEVLGDVSTLQEEFKADQGKYTLWLSDLRERGLTYDESKVDLFVSWADNEGFCAEAAHVSGSHRHFDSWESELRTDACPARERARENWLIQNNDVLGWGYIAQLDYRSDHDGKHATTVKQLRPYGFRSPYRQVVKLRVAWAEDSRFCLQARHLRRARPRNLMCCDDPVRTRNRGCIELKY